MTPWATFALMRLGVIATSRTARHGSADTGVACDAGPHPLTHDRLRARRLGVSTMLSSIATSLSLPASNGTADQAHPWLLQVVPQSRTDLS